MKDFKDLNKENEIDNIINNYSILKRRPRVVFDMDDVIVDYVGTIVEEFNEDNGTNYTVEDCKEWKLEKIFGQAINDYIYFNGRFDDLPIKNNSVTYINKLIESGRYDIFIVSACPPQGFIEKYNWIKKYMPLFNLNRLIPCCEKSAIWCDCIVDDKLDNIKELITNPIINTIGFIYDMPHNRVDDDLFKKENNVYRIKDLSNMLNDLDNIYYPNLKRL